MSGRTDGAASRLLVAAGRLLLRLLLRGADREFLRGDLEEAREARARRIGAGAAARWYLGQVVRSAWTRRVATAQHTGRRLGGGDGWIRESLRDLRFAARILRTEPGFAASAVAMLALGVGGTTAIFVFVNGLLLKPLPYAEGHRLVELQEVGRSGGRQQVDFFNFRDWRERVESLESLEAFYATSFNAFDGQEPVRVSGLRVGDRLFEVLRTAPVLGRTFAPGEADVDAEPVVVIADSLWRRLFGGDPEVVGRTLRLQGLSHTIVGVMPAGFHFREYAEVWVPHRFDAANSERGSQYWRVVGRLAPGASLEAAADELDRLGRQLAAEHPRANGGRTATVISLREAIVGDSGMHALIFLVAVVLVQMIATVNVGNLLLARSLSRRREMAIRAAIGAGRGRLVRQLLTESFLLALTGGAAGVVLGLRGRTWILDSVPIIIPRWFDFSFDYRAALFSLFASLLAGLVFGLVPALLASRDVAHALRDGDRAASAAPRLRSWLVVAEVALTLVLLVGAGLMLKAAERTRRVDPGLQAEGVLTFRVSLPADSYDLAESRAYVEQLRERLASLPGVERSAAISSLPLSNSASINSVFAEELDLREGERPPSANLSVVDGDYFGALQVPIVRGRDLRRSVDGDGVEVVVSEGLARRLWGSDDVLGRRLKLGDATSDSPWMTVVGVAAGVRHHSLREERTTETLYLPLARSGSRSMTFVVRTPRDPMDLAGAVREAVRGQDPDVPLYSLRSMERVVSDSMWQARVYSWMFGVFAALALALATVGLYGLVAYGARRRRREIGVRLALGAGRREVVRMVVAGALGKVGLGVALGLVASLAFSRLMSSLVYGVSVTDPLVYGAVVTTLLAVGSLSAIVPAVRASREDPLAALRDT